MRARAPYHKQARDCPICGGTLYPGETCEVCGYSAQDQAESEDQGKGVSYD